MILKKCCLLFVALLGCLVFLNVQAESLPSYLTVAAAKHTPPTASQIAANNVASLDADMQAIYSNNLPVFEQNLRDNYPVILALFTDEGGKFYLYKPGQKEPIIAPPVPQIYVLAKSVGHSSMATYQLLIRYAFDASNDHSWEAPVRKFLEANESALKSVDNLNVSNNIKATFKNVLNRNINFMKTCLKNGTYTLSDIKAYAQSQNKDLQKLIGYATEAQVNHWMSVLTKWKAMLGSQWKDAYAVSNTLYVTRRKKYFIYYPCAVHG